MAVRLSEAIMLGAATCRLEPGNINSCALGCAANAMGVPKSENCYFRSGINEVWPWLSISKFPENAELIYSITEKFDYDVCDGDMTLEQLADYVRAIEPDCDCATFHCDCATKQATPTHEEAHVAV